MSVPSPPKSKHILIRKPLPAPKPTRHIKVARLLPIDPNSSLPPPGTLEADFLLEAAPDPRPFLEIEETPTSVGPRYYAEGKIIPYSIVGGVGLFEKPAIQETKSKTVETKSRSEDTVSRRSALSALRGSKSINETPELKLSNKLLRIEEGKKKDAVLEAERWRKLPIGMRIVEERHKKSLRGFELAQKSWNIVTSAISVKSGRIPPDLIINQHQVFREKLEDIDLMDRAISSQAKTGPNAWYLSLRSGTTPESRGNYVSVGNLFSGIYPQVKDRPQSAGVIIRKPGKLVGDGGAGREEGEGLGKKTFRNNPYFQKRMKEEEMKKAAQELQPASPASLWIKGVGKFAIEREALVRMGIEAFRPELVQVGNLSEEVISEQYDVKYKY